MYAVIYAGCLGQINEVHYAYLYESSVVYRASAIRGIPNGE